MRKQFGLEFRAGLALLALAACSDPVPVESLGAAICDAELPGCTLDCDPAFQDCPQEPPSPVCDVTTEQIVNGTCVPLNNESVNPCEGDDAFRVCEGGGRIAASCAAGAVTGAVAAGAVAVLLRKAYAPVTIAEAIKDCIKGGVTEAAIIAFEGQVAHLPQSEKCAFFGLTGAAAAAVSLIATKQAQPLSYLPEFAKDCIKQGIDLLPGGTCEEKVVLALASSAVASALSRKSPADFFAALVEDGWKDHVKAVERGCLEPPGASEWCEPGDEPSGRLRYVAESGSARSKTYTYRIGSSVNTIVRKCPENQSSCDAYPFFNWYSNTYHVPRVQRRYPVLDAAGQVAGYWCEMSASAFSYNRTSLKYDIALPDHGNGSCDCAKLNH